jgi:hypothetical protein
VHERDRRALLRPALAEHLLQSLECREGPALHAADLAAPVVELTVEVAVPVGDRVEAGRAEVDRVDRRDLVDHVLAHPPDACRVGT